MLPVPQASSIEENGAVLPQATSIEDSAPTTGNILGGQEPSEGAGDGLELVSGIIQKRGP